MAAIRACARTRRSSSFPGASAGADLTGSSPPGEKCVLPFAALHSLGHPAESLLQPLRTLGAVQRSALLLRSRAEGLLTEGPEGSCRARWEMRPPGRPILNGSFKGLSTFLAGALHSLARIVGEVGKQPTKEVVA